MPLLEVLGLKGPGGRQERRRRCAGQGKKSEAERADAAAFKRFEAFAKRVDAELDKAKLAVDAQPIAAIKATLRGRAAGAAEVAPRGRRAGAGEAAKRVEQLDSPASNFRLKVEGTLKDGISAKRDVEERCVKPLAAITAKVNALTGGWKEVFEPQLKRIQAGMVEVNARLDKGEFDAIIKPLADVFYACQNLDAAVEGYKTDYQPFVDAAQEGRGDARADEVGRACSTPRASRTSRTSRRCSRPPTRSARSAATRRRWPSSTRSSSRRWRCATPMPPTPTTRRRGPRSTRSSSW